MYHKLYGQQMRMLCLLFAKCVSQTAINTNFGVLCLVHVAVTRPTRVDLVGVKPITKCACVCVPTY